MLTILILLVSSLVFAQEAPRTLDETGYWAPRNREFTVADPLWSDGWLKRRVLALPAGQALAPIGSEFEFPDGTTIWKDFGYAVGKGFQKIETRWMHLSSGKWSMATYVWRADQLGADLAPYDGVVLPVAGRNYQVPSRDACFACHHGGLGAPLGLVPIQLSHGDWRELTGRVDEPPVWPTAEPVVRRALGYLAANCSSCHRPGGAAEFSGLHLQFEPGMLSADRSPAYTTAVGQPSGFQLPDEGGVSYRVVPGSPDRSALLYRMMSRDPGEAMPPLGTAVVDQAGVAAVREWILGL